MLTDASGALGKPAERWGGLVTGALRCRGRYVWAQADRRLLARWSKERRLNRRDKREEVY